MKKKLLSGLALLSPAAVFAADGSGYAGVGLPADVDSALTAAQNMGTMLAGKVGPVVLAIGAAFIGVAVVWFCIRLIGGFLAKRRGV